MNTKGEPRSVQAHELDKPLGPEYVSFKNGHAYIEGHKVVKLANEVFGFDGWSSEVRNMTIDYEEKNNNRFTIGVSCTMRITLKSGVFREDIGYGSSVNMPHRYQAHDKARKEATTDALKRALRQFGESLGNCLYNREYVEMVKRMKPEKPTFDVEDLRRPRKKIKTENPPAPSGPVTAPQPAPTGKPQQANVPPFMFDDNDDDDDDFEGLPRAPPKAAQEEPRGTNDDPIPPAPGPLPLSTNDDAVFVSADHADLVQSPQNQSTPLPSDALFDVSKSSLKNSTVPQDRSMRIPRRPKT